MRQRWLAVSNICFTSPCVENQSHYRQVKQEWFKWKTHWKRNKNKYNLVLFPGHLRCDASSWQSEKSTQSVINLIKGWAYFLKIYLSSTPAVWCHVYIMAYSIPGYCAYPTLPFIAHIQVHYEVRKLDLFSSIIGARLCNLLGKIKLLHLTDVFSFLLMILLKDRNLVV